MAMLPTSLFQRSFTLSPVAKIVLVLLIVILVAIPVAFWKVAHDKNAAFTSYHGDSYAFMYPKNWTFKKTERSDTGGSELFLLPPDAAPPESPNVIIDVAPATQDAISRLTDSFIIFKYTKTDATVAGFPAEKYTTVVHASEGVLHSIGYVFQAKGNIYVILLEYKQETADIQLESQVARIVTTFTSQ